MPEWKAAEVMRGLMHHGVKGQKWGERNGPPYPLNAAGKARASRNGGDGGKGRSGGVNSESSDTEVAGIATSLALSTALTLTTLAARKIRKNVQVKMAVGKSNADHLAEDRQNEEIDPETGLYLKNGVTTKKEDMAKVNPNYKMAEAFQVNCTKCTAAMEMRCRGYDVAAGKMGADGDKHVGGLSADKYNKWFGDDQNPGTPVEIPRFGTNPYDKPVKAKDYIKQVTAEMKKGGEGARGELVLHWPNGSGHSMFYTVENGEAVVYDAQVNKRIAEKDLFAQRLGDSGVAFVRRLDNLNANVEQMKQDNAIN